MKAGVLKSRIKFELSTLPVLEVLSFYYMHKDTKIDTLPLILLKEDVKPFTRHFVWRIQGLVQLHPNMLQNPPSRAQNI